MFKVPERYRITKHPVLASNVTHGNNGAFIIPFGMRTKAFCIVSDGLGWEHVSVHLVVDGEDRTPTWAAMCKIKDIFWDEGDCVIQYHPPKSEYVNNHKHTLHLWKPTNQTILMPDSILVGVKGYQAPSG